MFLELAASLLLMADTGSEAGPPRIQTAPATDRNEAARVLGTERNRLDAEVEADVPTVDRLVADDVVYTHGSGERQTKRQYLDALATGKSRYRRIATTHSAVIIMGGCALTHGDMTLDLAAGQHVVTRYAGAYRKVGDDWRLVSWQSTPIKDEIGKASAEAR